MLASAEMLLDMSGLVLGLCAELSCTETAVVVGGDSEFPSFHEFVLYCYPQTIRNKQDFSADELCFNLASSVSCPPFDADDQKAEFSRLVQFSGL